LTTEYHNRGRWTPPGAIFTCMTVPSKRLLAGLCGAATLASAPALATSTPPATRTPNASERALLDSHELWATIDVCSPPGQTDTVGVRGSMPGDGQAGDKMYMSFRLQYMDASKEWVDLTSGASTSFVAVGAGSSARQAGTSFQLQPVAGKPASTLRGVVDFQWRRGRTVLLSTARPSTSAHRSLAGADPANFSAATCVIG
jgi:hypothetical protein